MKESEKDGRLGSDKDYVLDNAGEQAPARFDALSAVFDPGTIHHLEKCGIAPGWHCLEVGGGGGSIAAWLSSRVGPAGRILVTDIDPRHLKSLKFPNLEVRCHNVATDPLPEASFDLVHSRLVLVHVLERERALERMIASLKPGGWLVDEEFDSSLSPDPALNPEEVLSKTHMAMTRVMASRGVDRDFGRRLFGRLRALGLKHVRAEGRAFMWQGGSPGASLLRSNYEQLRSAMIDAGYVTEQEFENDVSQLQNPSFVVPSPILWTASGQRPSADSGANPKP
jgi:SAM-dependent methyltransferase